MLPNRNIVIQIRHTDNHISFSALLEFNNEKECIQNLTDTLSILRIKGVMTIENNELPNLKLGTVGVQTNAMKERQDHYIKTGN